MDLVDRLRKPRAMMNGLPVGECYGCYDAERTDAAVEIGRLRAALQSIVDEPLDAAGYDEVKRTAREALSLN